MSLPGYLADRFPEVDPKEFATENDYRNALQEKFDKDATSLVNALCVVRNARRRLLKETKHGHEFSRSWRCEKCGMSLRKYKMSLGQDTLSVPVCPGPC